MSILVNAALCFGLISGSFSIGSLFLRIGWPKVKIIDEEYRRGWALAIGLIFSFAVIFGALLLWLLIGAYGYAQYLLLVLLAGFVAGVIITTAKRKFSSIPKVKVEIPKEKIASSAASEKAVEMLQENRKFIKVAKMEEGKLAKLREKLGVQAEVLVVEERAEVEEKAEAKQFSPSFSAEKAGEEGSEEQSEDAESLGDWEPEKKAEDEIMDEVKKEIEKEKAEKAAVKIAKEEETSPKPAVKAPEKPAEKIPEKEVKEKVIGDINEVKKKLREAFVGKEQKKEKEDVSLDWPKEEKEDADDDKLSPLQELLKKKKKEIGMIKKRM